MTERRGAPVAARTVAFLFARACNRRVTTRALARILERRAGGLEGNAKRPQNTCKSWGMISRSPATISRCAGLCVKRSGVVIGRGVVGVIWRDASVMCARVGFPSLIPYRRCGVVSGQEDIDGSRSGFACR